MGIAFCTGLCLFAVEGNMVLVSGTYALVEKRKITSVDNIVGQNRIDYERGKITL